MSRGRGAGADAAYARVLCLRKHVLHERGQALHMLKKRLGLPQPPRPLGDGKQAATARKHAALPRQRHGGGVAAGVYAQSGLHRAMLREMPPKTPWTNCGERSPEYCRAISTASLTTTFSGVLPSMSS